MHARDSKGRGFTFVVEQRSSSGAYQFAGPTYSGEYMLCYHCRNPIVLDLIWLE